MSEITIQKIPKEKLDSMNVESWPVWECEPSEFDWEYSDTETCYIIEGRVTVETAEGAVSFGSGDYVIFPKGLKCRWKVTEKVRKHYKFG